MMPLPARGAAIDQCGTRPVIPPGKTLALICHSPGEWGEPGAVEDLGWRVVEQDLDGSAFPMARGVLLPVAKICNDAGGGETEDKDRPARRSARPAGGRFPALVGNGSRWERARHEQFTWELGGADDLASTPAAPT
jgi:hypothetical protein